MGRTKGSKNGVRKVPLKKPNFKYEEYIIFNENVELLEPSLPVFNTSVLFAYRNKEYQKCIELIEGIFTSSNDINKDHYKLLQAASYTMLGENFDIAHSILDKVLLTDPLNSFAMYGKGVALYFESKFEESIAMFDQAIKTNPGEQMERAKDMKMRIDLEQRKAVIRIEKMNRLSETNEVILAEDIESLIDELDVTIDGDHFNDLELFKEERDDELTNLNLEGIQPSTGSYGSDTPYKDNEKENMQIDDDSLEMTEEDMKKSISGSPQPDGLNNSFKQERVTRSKLIKTASLSADVMFLKGMELYEAGSLKKSIKLFGKVLKLNPSLTEAEEMATKARELLELMNVAATNMSQKRYDAVVEILNEALEIDKNNMFVNRPFFYQRGLAYFHLGKSKESMKDYAQFDRINKLITKT